MILPLREIDVLGVFVAPFALCLPAAFVATLVVLASLRRVVRLDWLSHSPWMELAVFTSLLSGLVLTLGRI